MYPISTGAHHMRTQFNVAELRSLGLPEYGALVPPEVKMLSQILREHGYYCTNNAKTDYQFQAPKTAWDESSPIADYTNRRADQPFFAVFNLEITHESRLWGGQIADTRFRSGFPKDSSFLGAAGQGSLPAHLRDPIDADLAVQVPPYLVDDDSTRNDLRRVYRNIQTMDEQVGFLMQRLRDQGLLESTIVIWYTDHGGPLPREKRLLYDSGLRVPMIGRWPDGWRAGQIDSSLLSFVDFLPTTLTMADIDPPAIAQGKVTFARGNNDTNAFIYAAADRFDTEYDRIRAVRNHRYKLLRNYRPAQAQYLKLSYRDNIPSMRSLLSGLAHGTLTPVQARWFEVPKDTLELYDLSHDPDELVNLARDPAHTQVVQELDTAMKNWLAEVEDLGAVPEVTMVKQWWGGQLDTMPQTLPPVLRRGENGSYTISSPTPGAHLAFRLLPDDTQKPGWRVYQSPVRLGASQQLQVVAQRIGYAESRIVSAWGQ